jgi:hypothetical protein
MVCGDSRCTVEGAVLDFKYRRWGTYRKRRKMQEVTNIFKRIPSSKVAQHWALERVSRR